MEFVRCTECYRVDLNIWAITPFICGGCRKRRLAKRKPREPRSIMDHIEMATRSSLDEIQTTKGER